MELVWHQKPGTQRGLSVGSTLRTAHPQRTSTCLKLLPFLHRPQAEALLDDEFHILTYSPCQCSLHLLPCHVRSSDSEGKQPNCVTLTSLGLSFFLCKTGNNNIDFRGLVSELNGEKRKKKKRKIPSIDLACNKNELYCYHSFASSSGHRLFSLNSRSIIEKDQIVLYSTTYGY